MQSRDEVTVEGLDLDAIAAVVGEFPVTLAILYGSYARGENTPASDLDVAVEFREDLTSVERTDARLGLIERLGAVTGTDGVDVVPLARAPPSLVETVVSEGILVYGAPEDVAPYRETAVRETTRQERLDEFDDLLDALERSVS